MTFINMTPFNALVDDDGSNSVGTLWNKSAISGTILTPIETAFSTFVGANEQTTTLTGTQHNLALGTGVATLRCTNATALTITGLTNGAKGQYLTIISAGAGTVSLSDQNASSTAANRLITGESATVTLGAGIDSVGLVYDNTTLRWRKVQPKPHLRAVAYHNTTQSLTTATITPLSLNSEDTDPSGMHDLVVNNSRVTIPTGGDGLYLVVGGTSFAGNATGDREVMISKNGTLMQYAVLPVSATTTTVLQVTFIGAAVAGDYFEVNGYQSSGGALNVGNAARALANSLSVTRL